MPVGLYGGALASDVWYELAGATKVRLKQIYTMDLGGNYLLLHQIAAAPSLAVVASPSSYANTVSSSAAGNVSVSFVAAASGGSGNYAYAWDRVAVGVVAAASSGESTATLRLAAAWAFHSNGEYSETWQVTATDTTTGLTATFSITFYLDIENDR